MIWHEFASGKLVTYHPYSRISPGRAAELHSEKTAFPQEGERLIPSTTSRTGHRFAPLPPLPPHKHRLTPFATIFSTQTQIRPFANSIYCTKSKKCSPIYLFLSHFPCAILSLGFADTIPQCSGDHFFIQKPPPVLLNRTLSRIDLNHIFQQNPVICGICTVFYPT